MPSLILNGKLVGFHGVKHPFVLHIQSHDPIIFQLYKQFGLPKLTISNDPFFSLIESIISQQLSVKASDTIVKRFRGLFVDPQTITPAQVILVDDTVMRSVGMSWNKVSYVKNIAIAVKNDSLNFSKLLELSDEAVIDQLVSIKGIGRWTAEMFLMFSLGRPDVFSYGDAGLMRSIKNLYNFPNKPNREDLERLCSSWRPYRTYVSKLLWQSLDTV